MGKRSLNTSEWTLFFNVELLNDTQHKATVTPEQHEFAAIAARLDVNALNALQAEIIVEQEQHSHLIRVSGLIHAEITQNCVVTLDPIKNTIKEEFESWFADHASAVSFASAKAKLEREQTGMQEAQMLEERDDPEPLQDGNIDLGELIIQHLLLAIDPYPHAAGVTEGAADIQEKPSPFAELKNIRFKSKSED